MRLFYTDIVFPIRYSDIVNDISTIDEVEAMAFCSGLLAKIISDEKLDQFLEKVVLLIKSGLLDPKKAESEEKLHDILNCLLRVCSLKMKVKSHFLKSDEHMKFIMEQFNGYYKLLDSMEKIVFGRILNRTGYPANLVNDVLEDLRSIVKSKDFQDFSPKADVLYVLRNRNVITHDKKEDLEIMLEDSKRDLGLGLCLEIAFLQGLKSTYQALIEESVIVSIFSLRVAA